MKLRNLPVIIVHCPQKVGSTGLVSSLRLFALEHYDIIHIHDERIFPLLGLPNEIKTVNDFVRWLMNQSKYVVVIQIYKTLIERNMSCFFEHCASFHFNANSIENYNLERLTKRFNQSFFYLDEWSKTNSYNNNYNGAKVIQLVSGDDINKTSKEWSSKLTKELGITIHILVDRPTTSPKYKVFKENYRVPFIILNAILNNDELNNMKMFFSESEVKQYFDYWDKRSIIFVPYNLWTNEEYSLYYEISSENQTNNSVSFNHYSDCGCVCYKCMNKRAFVVHNINYFKSSIPKITHT